MIAALITKRCPICGEHKGLADFPRNRSKKDGLASYCKPCHNKKMKEIAERLYGGNANFLMMKRYGITKAEFRAVVDAQGGLCAICSIRPAKHLDHDHATGKNRAALCFSCNRGLGKFGDNPEFIRRAQAYLRQHLESI